MTNFQAKYTFELGCSTSVSIGQLPGVSESYVLIKLTNTAYEEGVYERGVYEVDEVVIELPVETAKALATQLKELSEIE
ncbi:hypothetical protein [Aerosakkonema funiforme]|uniref:hypothetical protein n=1 Tax=Aerosakkonema funiforme TaxID=1246630 RepID=UPI0035B7B73A